MHLEQNKELELAWEYVTHTSMNLFLTGKAGSGKTTFLKHVVRECPKRKIVLAPTGVAAINAGGVTLHSFFQLPFGLFLPDYAHVQAHDREGRYKFHRKKLKIIRSIDLMIIDEVSMLRADILDELDSLLRKLRHSTRPFGGVQVLMIGDVQQLAPVVRDEEWQMMSRYYASPYFFDAHVLREHPYRLVELEKIYRQKDSEFIDILSAVRQNRLTHDLLATLNERYIPDYEAPEGCITLCTHNNTTREINTRRLEALPAREYTYTASIEGNFPESMYPQDEELHLKVGAQVMFTKNDPNPERLFVNGTIGKVTALDEDFIEVELPSGEAIDVEPLPWENLRYEINEESKEIVSVIDGLFTQYPLKTAWAITIHKSQGLTFDRAVIDAGRSFSHGQVYVALSRCRTLEGIVLRQKITPTALIDDRRVDSFSDYVAGALPSENDLREDRRAYFREVVKDLFSMEELRRLYYTYLKFVRFTFPGLFSKALSRWTEAEEPFKRDIVQVGERFQRSLDRIVGEDYLSSEFLRERIFKASDYFLDHALRELIPLVEIAAGVDFDDKAKKRLNRQYFTNFVNELFTKLFLWNHVREGFDLERYLEERAVVSAELPNRGVKELRVMLNRAMAHPDMGFARLTTRKTAERPTTDAPATQNDEEEEVDIAHPEIFERLRQWRYAKASELQIPPYCILHQKPMITLSNFLPETPAELLSIKGIGKTFVSKYGDEILALINSANAGG